MTHILKELSKRNMHISLFALFNEDKWHKRSPKDDFGAFRGGGHFWRVTPLGITRIFKDLLRSFD